MEWLTDYTLWASFVSLSALEIVLGIDNVIFIALLAAHLPPEKRLKARAIGLSLAMAIRIVMLLGINHIIGMEQPVLSFLGEHFSGRDLMLIAGGLFLIYKGTDGVHDDLTGEIKGEAKSYSGNFFSTVVQIIITDIVFSFDSVMTAVGLTRQVGVIVAAMIAAMAVMMFVAPKISDFIEKYPTLKMLALSFILMVGVLLVAEGFGYSIPKQYLYFAMAFSLGVETVNIQTRKKLGK